MDEMVLIFRNTKYHRPGKTLGRQKYTACGKRIGGAPWKRIPRADADASGYRPCSECWKERD